MGVTSLGTALSTAVGGIVGNFLSWRALFGAYGVLSLGVTAALFLVPSPGRAAGPGRRHAGPAAAGSAICASCAPDRARLLYVLVALEGLFVQGGFTYLGAYLQDRFGLDYLSSACCWPSTGRPPSWPAGSCPGCCRGSASRV